MPESREQLPQGWKSPGAFEDYRLQDGVFVRPGAVAHDASQYDARGYRMLSETQRRHFWHRGRYRFLSGAVRRHLPLDQRTGTRVIDLGAGCGGWMDYMLREQLFPGSQLALGDSSLVALKTARTLVAGEVACFQIDLLNLGLDRCWDTAFLLDVIEHIDDDVAALRNAQRALAPGGWLFVTVPALDTFWSWNDEIVQHKRRYSAERLRAAGEAAGLTPIDVRYFMFLLSPLLFASRLLSRPKLSELSHDEQWALIDKTHAVPAAPLNALLAGVFSLETPLARALDFPWGTSALGVFRKAS